MLEIDGIVVYENCIKPLNMWWLFKKNGMRNKAKEKVEEEEIIYKHIKGFQRNNRQ